MNTIAPLPQQKQGGAVWIPLLIAVSATLFLFYIDEGFYDFRWMADPGNWLVFGIYVGIITGVQLVLGFLFFRRFAGWTRGLLSGLLGLALGLVLAFWVFS